MNNQKACKASYDLLGPIFYRFLFKLYLSQSVYEQNDTALLFLARGGIRIQLYYEQFLKQNGLESPIFSSGFYISRMAVIKASMISNYDTVYYDFLKEYAQFSVSETICAFFGQRIHDLWIQKPNTGDPTVRLDQDRLNQLFWADTESADYLRGILLEQQKLYLGYLKEVVGDKKNVIVVDTGWSGSILNNMQCLDKNRSYTALYFGRYNYGENAPPWFNKIIGVEVEDHDFNRKRPITALFLNRHLIEGLCQIRWPSTTGYQKTKNALVEPIGGFAPDDSVLPLPEETQAYGILKYLIEARDGLDIEKIHDDGERAAQILCQKMMYPKRDDLSFFSVKTRSADFGKEKDVPVFMPSPESRFNLIVKMHNIKDSLWPTGQITLEFPLIHLIVQFLYHRQDRILAVSRKLGIIACLKNIVTILSPKHE